MNVKALRGRGVAAKNAVAFSAAKRGNAVHTAALGNWAALVGMIEIHGRITAFEGTSGRDHVFGVDIERLKERDLGGASNVEMQAVSRRFVNIPEC